MKALRILLAMAIIFVAGCTNDYLVDENLDRIELKKAKVPVPIKGKFCAVPDMEYEFLLLPVPGLDPTDPNNYVASRLKVSGTSSHLGKIDAEKSYYEIETLEFVPEDGIPFLMSTGIGKMVAANGDCYQYTWWAKLSLPDFNMIGETEVLPGSGTGRFEGILGSTEMIGQGDLVNQINCWTAEGYVVFE